MVGPFSMSDLPVSYTVRHRSWSTRRLRRAARVGDWTAVVLAAVDQADPNTWVRRCPAGSSSVIEAPVLFWALEAGESAAVEALLLAGASVTVRRPANALDASQGETALDWVRKEADLLALLRAGLGQFVPCGNVYRDSVLHVASEHGWVNAVRHVVRCNGMVEVRNHVGHTPLHALVRRPHPPRERIHLRRTLAFLVEAGASLEARDHQGLTPLDHAQLHNPGMVRFLVEAGAEPSALTTRQRAVDCVTA